MRQQVLKLAIRTAILAVALILGDRIVGAGLEYLFYQQTHGDDYTTLYALEKADDEVMVFGTSRASHHYNAKFIEEETGMTCFNAGRDEMEIPYTNALLDGMFTRHKPEVIILDIGPMELAGEKQVVYERVAAALMPYADKYPMFEPAIERAGEMELIKIKVSKIYPYNSKLGSSIQNAYTNLGHLSEQGYEPLYHTIDTSIYKESIWEDIDKNYPVREDYVKILKGIINKAQSNNIKLVVAISPFYFPYDFSINDSYKKIQEITSAAGVPMLDFSNDPEFTSHPLLFHDDIHLNDDGATIYSRKIIQRLRDRGIL